VLNHRDFTEIKKQGSEKHEDCFEEEEEQPQDSRINIRWK
jgi:hypothetical protein